MRDRPDRQLLRSRLRSLRTGVIWASGISFAVALGLVATNPQGTQAAAPSSSGQDSGAQQPIDSGGDSSNSYGSPVIDAPANQPPILHSRRS